MAAYDRSSPSGRTERTICLAPMPVVGSSARASQLPTGSFPSLLGYLAYSAWRSSVLIWFDTQVRAASAVWTAIKRASGISAKGLAEAISRATSAISIQSLSLPSPRCANALHATTLAQ